MCLVIQRAAPFGDNFDHDRGESHQYEYQDDHSEFQGAKCQQVLHAYGCKEENKLHAVDNNLAVSAKGRIHGLKGCHVVPAGYQETCGAKHDVAVVHILADQHDGEYTACDGHCCRECIHKYVAQEAAFNLVEVVFLSQKEGGNSHCTGTDQGHLDRLEGIALAPENSDQAKQCGKNSLDQDESSSYYF